MPMSAELLEKCKEAVVDPNCSLETRFRALFSLRNHNDAQGEAADVILNAIANEQNSALFKHEAVYCLGQMKTGNQKEYLKMFKSIIEDETQDAMVRHEAAEAAAVVGDNDSSIIDFLSKYRTDREKLVADTCVLAVSSLEAKQPSHATEEPSKFNSYDPSKPHSCKDPKQLSEMLNSKSSSLVSRYQALFALRDLASENATSEPLQVLCSAMGRVDERAEKGDIRREALFRHELAFVLGQLGMPNATKALVSVLSNVEEHYVVRHESAFALGSCCSGEDQTQKEGRAALEKFSIDPCQVVRESCLVGLDMLKYNEGDEFHFSDALVC